MTDESASGPMLRVRGLDFRYGDDEFRLAVPELDVARGERVACIGPSGTGKTTLIHLMTGILEGKAECLELDGVDLMKLGDRERRALRIARVGLVFQQFELLDYLDSLDNILLPYFLSPALPSSSDTRERGREIARRMGIEHVLKRRPEALSQGERQRVAISRALVTRPGLIIADEPTGNLDPANAQGILDLLFEHCERQGATLVVVTHDHGLLGRFDRVVDMGEIAQGGAA